MQPSGTRPRSRTSMCRRHGPWRAVPHQSSSATRTGLGQRFLQGRADAGSSDPAFIASSSVPSHPSRARRTSGLRVLTPDFENSRWITFLTWLSDIPTKMLEILRSQLGTGYASELDVAAEQAQLAQVAATLPPLWKQLAQQRDQFSRLRWRIPQPRIGGKIRAVELRFDRRRRQHGSGLRSSVHGRFLGSGGWARTAGL